MSRDNNHHNNYFKLSNKTNENSVNYSNDNNTNIEKFKPLRKHAPQQQQQLLQTQQYQWEQRQHHEQLKPQQCDQMRYIILKYLAIYTIEKLPKSLLFCQSKFKILPNTK